LIFLLLALCSFGRADIFTVATPVSYADACQGTWAQSFQVLRGTASPTTTLIVLPGGPGATTITPTPPARYFDVPARWNVLLTDPRGAGCNTGPPSATFSTDTLARDILTIIKRASVTDYVLYGVSYGSVEATTLESLIEADPTVARPRALVLEGTIGHAWNGYDDYFQGFPFNWERTKRDFLQPSTVAMFAGPPYPLGISSTDWALVISSQLNVDDVPGAGNALKNLLEPLNETAMRRILGQFKGITAEAGPLILAIFCSELTGNFRTGDLSGNQLVLSGPNLCPGGFTRRYDSAALSISVPVYYFQGQDDPAVRPGQFSIIAACYKLILRRDVQCYFGSF